MATDSFRPNEQRQKDLKAATEYIAKLKDGERVSWLELERVLGFKMNDRGKDIVRLAAKRLRRPLLPLPGHGIEMSSADNGLDIVGKKVRTFVNALDTAKKTTDQVTGRHINEMTEDKKQALLRHQAVFGALTLGQSLAAKKLPQ